MKAALFGWIILCFVVQQESECITTQGRQPAKILNRWENNKLVHNESVYEKRSAIARSKVQKTHTEQILPRKNARSTFLKQKRSSNSTKSFDCCRTAKFISLPGTRKDVLIRNPQNVHFAKNVIVGNQFRNLLKVLYRSHSKDAQAIKRKISNGHFQLSGSKGEDGDDKINIYNIEDKSDASKNKTIIELRAAILKLLDKVVKKAKSSHLAEQRDQKQEFPNQLSEKNNFSKTAKTEIQESYKEISPSSLDKDEDLSARRANYLDLLNFITRMKSTDIGRDVDSRHRNRMPSLNGMDINGLSGMLNQRDMMTQNSFRPMPQIPDSRNAQDENGFLTGNGPQMQEMNLAEQRKLIEDQMENHVAQLQMKAKLLEQQQDVAPMQNLQNDQMSKFTQNLQNTIATPSVGVNAFGFSRQPMFRQAPFLPRVNPYSPFARPMPRFRTGLPFIRPMSPRVRYPPENEDDDDDYDDDDDDNDEHDRDRDEPPPHHPVREFEDNDDEDEEHNDSDNDER